MLAKRKAITMDISTLNEQELKALAFDTQQELERVQNNYRIILNELAQRETPAPEDAPAETLPAPAEATEAEAA